MKLSTSLVAVKKIISTVPRSNFLDEDLDRAANLILRAEGIINPLILRRTSLESYEVINGDFEYYAAAKAREIDPRKGEMIGAFIIEAESENEESIKEQIKLIRQKKEIDGQLPVNQPQPTVILESQSQANVNYSSVEQQIKNLFQQLEISLAETLTNKIEQSVKGLEEAVKKELLGNQDNQLSQQEKPKKPDESIEILIPEPEKIAKKRYKDMTVAELKDMAKKRKIKLNSKMRKDEIIAVLKKTDAS